MGIIGMGNIGSHIAINLARVGIEILHLYDNDKVEEHNVTSQSYTENDIGKYKVVAVKEQIKAINPKCVVFIHGNAKSKKPYFRGDSTFLAIAVDTMEERKKIMRIVQNGGRRWGYQNLIKRIVDIRVGGEQIDVFNTNVWSYYLAIRDNADVEPCGAEFVSYVSYMAGALGAKEILKCIESYNSEELLDNISSYSLDVKNMQIVNGI